MEMLFLMGKSDIVGPNVGSIGRSFDKPWHFCHIQGGLMKSRERQYELIKNHRTEMDSLSRVSPASRNKKGSARERLRVAQPF